MSDIALQEAPDSASPTGSSSLLDDICGMQIKFHPNPKNREKRRALSYS
ncbi:hypothetical protein ACP3S7_14640 [Phytobacter ursingii]